MASIKKVYNFILVTLVSVTLCFTTCSIVVSAEEYEEVTSDLALTWTHNRGLNYTTGVETYDNVNEYSNSNFITYVDGAKYNVSITGTYVNHVAVFYYRSDGSFISYQNCWSGNEGNKSVDLVIPSGTSKFRLLMGAGSTDDNIQNAITLKIKLTETVLVATGKSVEELLDISINGYESDVMEDATNTFSSEADILHNVESDLMDTSNQYVNDYTSEAFDTSFLDTLGDSLIFVVTWFTNFWNMGGAFTSCLNFLFALSIVFYIVRIR